MFFEKDIRQFTIHYDLPLKEFYQKLDKRQNNFFCVINEKNKIVGVLSLGDLARAQQKSFNDKTLHVSDVMNVDYYALRYGSPLSTLIDYLKKYRFVPIVDEFDNIKMLAKGDPNKREFHLATHSIEHQEDYILIAEIGNNHNASMDRAFELIRLAKANGAHIAKFQMRDLTSLY